ncbi:MAG: PTS sugar transporter subunit IIB [Clostridia bacterium]|nr:PTS sugar transporter subunit IIB [Clostridia bacterium]
MRNIVLARIDDRLIHGQIVTAWLKQTNGNTIAIVDDLLPKDPFMLRILKAASPPGISVEILNVEDAIAFLSEDSPAEERLVILTKIPQAMEKLIDGGILLEKIILGGMGAKAGRQKFNKNISASPEEVESMKHILGKNVELLYQLVPNDRPADVKKLL